MRVAPDLFSADTLQSAIAKQAAAVQNAWSTHASSIQQLAERSGHVVASTAEGAHQALHAVSSQALPLQTISSQALVDRIQSAAASGIASVQQSFLSEAQRDVQRLGQSLRDLLTNHSNMLHTRLSSDTREAIERMAATAVALPQAAITELRESKALTVCAASCARHELLQLRTLMSRAAASGTAVELLALWSVVHSTISDAIPAEELKTLLESVSTTVMAESQAIGRLLQQAISSSMALAAAVSVELQEAIKNMAEYGEAIPATATLLQQELAANAKLIAEALPTEQLAQLQAHLQKTLTNEYQGLRQLGDELKLVAKATAVPGVVSVLADGIKSVVFDNPFTQILAKTDASVDKLLSESRASVNDTIAALTNGVSAKLGCGCLASLTASLPPLLRLEILRDFCQTASLFFTNLYATVESYADSPFVAGLQLFFQSFFNIISADFTALWGRTREMLIDAGFTLLLGVILVTYAAYLWFALSGRHLHKRSEEIRHGHESTSWAELAAKRRMRLRIFTAVLTLCLSVYLPLTRLCIEIVAAMLLQSSLYSSSALDDMVSPSTHTILERYGRVVWLWALLQIGAIGLLVTFTVPLPVLLVRAISENKPTGSHENPLITYDVDGEEVAFDEKEYARLIASDPSQLRCPYRSLYAGFEPRWSHYKVFQLLFKIALIVPLVLTRHRGIRSIVCTVIYSLILLLTSYGTPFNDPLNNAMEISGKTAALVTCVGGLVLAYLDSTSHANLHVAVGLVVNLVNAVNLLVMVTILLFGLPRTRLWIKNRLGTLTFSDTVRDIQDGPSHKIIPHWDLEKEAKHRIWHHFWHALLLSLENKAEREKVVQRLAQLQRAVTDSGLGNVQRHWQGHADQYTASMRLAARRLLEGVDVYWDDALGTRDGILDSASCFGKMYIRPYPFHCVMVYDDSSDESIIRDDKFAAFFMRNFAPDVLAKRALRHKLRALSDGEVTIHFPFARQETVAVEDGTETETTTDAEGRTQTRTKTRYSTVAFTCYYTTGVVRVVANSTKHAMAAGFLVSMAYEDGYGEAVAPHTGQVHPQRNRTAVMGPDHVGLTPQMLESPQLTAIFQQTRNRWEPGIEQLLQRHHKYRQQLIDRHEQANSVLGDGFWYFVFNNASLSRGQLVYYLQTQETNKVLRRLPETHAASLDFLYQRLGFVHSHAACRLWYVFWDDVFARNGSMQRLAPFAKELDPAQPGSVAYRVMKREELTQWLKERRLWGRPFSWQTLLLGRPCLFHDRMLQALYERLHALMEPDAVAVKGGKRGR